MPKETVEEVLREKPLVGFSLYTAIQSDILLGLSDEIRGELDGAFRIPEQVQGGHFDRAYGLFWLWVLGTYEVVRTMSGKSECFSQRTQKRILAFKKRISELRMPFAKQEYRGQKDPIRGEASVWGIEHEKKDLEFEVKDKLFSIQEMLTEFDSLIRSFSVSDIKGALRDSYD